MLSTKNSLWTQFLVLIGVTKKNDDRGNREAPYADEHHLSDGQAGTLVRKWRYANQLIPYYYYLMVFVPLLLGFTAVLLPLLGVIGGTAAIISIAVGVATVAAATGGHFFYLYARCSDKFDEVTSSRHLLAAGVIVASIVLLALIGVAPVAAAFATTVFAGVSVGIVLSVAAAVTIILTVLGHGWHIDTRPEFKPFSFGEDDPDFSELISNLPPDTYDEEDNENIYLATEDELFSPLWKAPFFLEVPLLLSARHSLNDPAHQLNKDGMMPQPCSSRVVSCLNNSR